MRKVFLWLYVVTASILVVGVLLQAFSIAAYVRGAGEDALDMHKTVGFLAHSVEIVVFLVALVGYWGMWRRLWLPFLLPVVGTFQLFMIGDTGKSGGWVNGLHGLFALIVFLLAAVLVQDGMRSLRASGRPAVAS
jgi:hypothetical protein